MARVITALSIAAAIVAEDMASEVYHETPLGGRRRLSGLAAHIALEGQRAGVWTRLTDASGREVMETLGPWLQATWGRGARPLAILRGGQ